MTHTKLNAPLKPLPLALLREAIAEKLATANRRPQSDLGAWLYRVTPRYRWDWAHLRYIISQLERVTSGEIKRLMLFVPPRHGKSELATIRYPVYRLANHPEMKVVVGAYNQTLAAKFSRKARGIAKQAALPLSDERSAADDWETPDGGGIRAVGVGTGVTGHGADLIIIDDPVKSREEAESKAYRDRVWDWYTDDLYTRLEPGAAMILIMTRWHQNDLAGRILESEDAAEWTVVKLPAEAEANDPLGRAVGEALCPDRYDSEALERIKRVLLRSWWALFQQTPRPREGEMFKTTKLVWVDAVPVVARRVRFWDKAATAGGGDFTVGVLVAEDLGRYYVENVERGQWGTDERDAKINETANLDAQRYGIGAVLTVGEEEGGSSGKDASQAFVRLLVGHRVEVERASGSKELRADPFSSQVNAGNVCVLRASWTAAFVDELANFPSGKNDDQVDGASGAFNRLARGLYAPTGYVSRSKRS